MLKYKKFNKKLLNISNWNKIFWMFKGMSQKVDHKYKLQHNKQMKEIILLIGWNMKLIMKEEKIDKISKIK